MAKERYYALDMLRGVAALAVVCCHVGGAFAGTPRFAGGSLAVDFFFILSGFVLTDAYDGRLRRGLSAAAFFRLRLVRFYPLYALGLLLGLAKMLLQIRYGKTPPVGSEIALDAMLGVVMLPRGAFGGPKDPIFPLDPPAWSLFFELAVNFAFAAVHPRLSKRVAAVILALSGSALVAVAVHWHGLDIGFARGHFWSAVPRVTFCFFAGVMLRRASTSLPAMPSALLAALAGALYWLLYAAPDRHRELYDLACACLAFPAIVLLGASVKIGGRLRALCAFSGDVSFAVYILHAPTLSLVVSVLPRLPPSVPALPIFGPAFLTAVLAFAWAADRWYDRPLRRWVAGKASGARPAADASDGAEEAVPQGSRTF